MPKIFSKFKLVFFCSAVFALFAVPSILAVETSTAWQLEVRLPGMPAAVSDPGAYIRVLFIFGLSLAGFLAVGAIVYGGILYMMAGTTITNVTKGRDYIIGALSGLALLFCSYLILNTIDPTLINLTPEPLELLDAVEPPSPPDSGFIAEETVTPTGRNKIKCKTNQICQDIREGRLNSTLVRDLSSLPSVITVTETMGSHGCSAQDPCAAGAACGTSTHCSGRAADIRIFNLSDEQRKQVMKSLSQNRCVNQLFYAGWPKYCRAGGGQVASHSQNCASHTDHIHYSVKENCS